MAGGSTITGFRIHQLTDVQNPLTGLGNAYFEVEVPLGPVAGAYTNLRLRGDRLLEWLDGRFGQGVWNAQKNPLKVVRTYADLLDLNPLSCCRGTKGVVLDDTPGYPAGDYLLLYTDHANAWNFVCQDGTFDQNPDNLTDAAWYPVDSPAVGYPTWSELQANPPTPDYLFPIGFIVRDYAGGSSEKFLKAKRNAVLPRPTTPLVATDWEEVSPGSLPTTTMRVAWENIVGDPADNDALVTFVSNASVTGVQKAALNANPSLSSTNPVAGFDDVVATVADQLNGYSLLLLPGEIENPPQYGPAGVYRFRPVDNAGYFFTTGGAVTMDPSGMTYTGSLVSLRLAETASELVVTAVGSSNISRVLKLAPGETVQLALVPANRSTTADPSALLSWKIISRGGLSTDIEITDPTKGVIQTDRTTGIRYRFKIAAGVFSLEPV